MKTLRVKSELSELEKIRGFLKDCLQKYNLGEEDFFRVELALVEMCTNIMRYAYPSVDGEIYLKAWHEDARFYLQIRDDGIPFDPRDVKKPSIREMIDREQMGGLGIFLARRLMDGFDYRREDDQNILTMFKKAVPKKA
jgi:anti-sigma regulatory factor (Ser/Thr protein kinase)